MKFSIREFLLTVVVAALTVALLWGGQRLYQNSAVRSPLVRSVETVPGVQSATLTPLGALNVLFRPSANLMSTYQAVESRAQASLGHIPNLGVVSRGNPGLRVLANQVRLIVAQGEATGQYVAMNRQILQAARVRGVQASVSLGNYNVFVSLRIASHYVDEVIPLGLGGGGHH